MLREAILMTALTALLVLVGYVVGLFLGNPTTAIQVALISAAIMNIAVYIFSDRIVLAMTGAKLISPSDEPQLHQTIERLAREARIPKPRVAIVPVDLPNAFATGRGPGRAVVAVTRGLLRELNSDEVEAVLGHEISHIRHRDTLVATMAATIAGAISYIAYMGRWGLWLGDGRRSEVNQLLLLLAVIFAPIAATMIQLAISREREYEADEGSAMITKKPISLANALIKIERAVRRRPMVDANPATSPLWIVNPFRGETLMELFSTHPPTRKRIERLRKIAREMGVNDAPLLEYTEEPIKTRVERVETGTSIRVHPYAQLRAVATLNSGLVLKDFDEVERAILVSLYRGGDMSHSALPKVLAKSFGIHLSLREVEEAIDRLSAKGLISLRSVFTAYIFGTEYTRMTIGLTPLGRSIARKLAGETRGD
ncbi:zinc metalloprotease HtpX [Candidatus Bathyarchaeota archaeon]|nr:zinc metalloprotease HtpX [Candidatus Bathyarchaeota archaeon]